MTFSTDSGNWTVKNERKCLQWKTSCSKTGLLPRLLIPSNPGVKVMGREAGNIGPMHVSEQWIRIKMRYVTHFSRFIRNKNRKCIPKVSENSFSSSKINLYWNNSQYIKKYSNILIKTPDRSISRLANI